MANKLPGGANAAGLETTPPSRPLVFNLGHEVEDGRCLFSVSIIKGGYLFSYFLEV